MITFENNDQCLVPTIDSACELLYPKAKHNDTV